MNEGVTVCVACGDDFAEHELLEGACFGCRYLRHLTTHEPLDLKQ